MPIINPCPDLLFLGICFNAVAIISTAFAISITYLALHYFSTANAAAQASDCHQVYPHKGFGFKFFENRNANPRKPLAHSLAMV